MFAIILSKLLACFSLTAEVHPVVPSRVGVIS